MLNHFFKYKKMENFIPSKGFLASKSLKNPVVEYKKNNCTALCRTHQFVLIRSCVYFISCEVTAVREMEPNLENKVHRAFKGIIHIYLQTYSLDYTMFQVYWSHLIVLCKEQIIMYLCFLHIS